MGYDNVLEIDGGGDITVRLHDAKGVEPDREFTFSFKTGDQKMPELYAYALANKKVFFNNDGSIYAKVIKKIDEKTKKVTFEFVMPSDPKISEWKLVSCDVRLDENRKKMKRAVAKHLTRLPEHMGGGEAWGQLVEEALATNDMAALAENIRITVPAQLIELAEFLARKHPKKYEELKRVLTSEEAWQVEAMSTAAPALSSTDSKLFNPYEEVHQILSDALDRLYKQPVPENAVVEVPAVKAYGDFGSNIALQLARTLRKGPKVIAQEMADDINKAGVKYTCEAQNGYINFKLKDTDLFDYVMQLENGLRHSVSLAIPEYAGKNINIEYVSANPTGPLHIGHGRWAVLGSCIANILRFAGAAVTEEF